MKVLQILLVIISISFSLNHQHHGHSCDHDELQSKVKVGQIPSAKKYITRNNERILSTNSLTLQSHFETKLLYVDAKMNLLNAGVKDYLKTTIFPYIQDYIKKVFKVYSTRYYDFTGVNTCITASLPASEQKVQQTDMLFLVTTQTQTSSLAASAGFCYVSTDNKRPILGEVLINTYSFNQYTTNTIKDFQFMAVVIMHEMFHALGFSSNAFQYFQDPTLTTTDKTMGASQVTKQITLRGKSVTVVKLPAVLQTARDYFNCQSMEGLELEDQGGSGTAGSHWDRRVAEEDMMVGIITNLQGMSNFTMSFFEATGWYKISSRHYAHNIQYGKNAGCNFINNVCWANNQALDANFCSNHGSANEPTMSLRSCGYCGYYNSPTTSNTLASYFNYYGSNKVYSAELNDNCPIVTLFSNRQCSFSDGSSRTAGTTYAYDSYYGDNGICIAGTWLKSGYVPQNKADCLKADCVPGQTSVARVHITTTYFVECTTAGATITLDSAKGYTGNIVCPDPQKVCVTYNNQNYQTFMNASVIPYENIVKSYESNNHYSSSSSEKNSFSIKFSLISCFIMFITLLVNY